MPWEKAAIVARSINHAYASACHRALFQASSLSKAMERLRAAFPDLPEQHEGEQRRDYLERARRWLSAIDGVDPSYLEQIRFAWHRDAAHRMRVAALTAPYRTFIAGRDREAIAGEEARLLALQASDLRAFDDVLDGLVQGRGLDRFTARYDVHDDLVVAARLVATASLRSRLSPFVISGLWSTHPCTLDQGRLVPGEARPFDGEDWDLWRIDPPPVGSHDPCVFYQHAALNLDEMIDRMREPERHLGPVVDGFLRGFTTDRLPRFRRAEAAHLVDNYFIVAEVADTEPASLLGAFSDPVTPRGDPMGRSVDRLLKSCDAIRANAEPGHAACLSNLASPAVGGTGKAERVSSPRELASWAAERIGPLLS